MALKPSKQFDVAVDSAQNEAETELNLQFNPFPGLRPFSFEESHLFFGREGQVDEILVKLASNRAVAVLGSSGSGKSSLVYCGLVPVLYGGFMTESGPNWNIINSRPGVSPLENLATSVADFMVSKGYLAKPDHTIQVSILLSVLRNSPFGLVEISKFLQRRGSENICYLLDQFEEIFRYKNLSEESRNEVSHYVNLILNTIEQKDVPAYMAISMRSDFINECAEFQGLTEILNRSNYVVPKMSREQKRMAIEGPVAVGGGRISNRLTKRLLADLENVQDALPILQHALMRTWDYWIKNREQGEPMDIRHYNAVGRIEQALSQHANEAYDELSARDKEIAEIVFKNITEKNQDNQGMRRPGRISEIAELAGATDEEVIYVVDQFRKPGRSFLMPGSQVLLADHSLVEISHESMMRIWTRLSGWVDDEFESSQMYKRLSDASAMYQIGRTGLWRPPDLQLALNWQKKQNPTRTWAQRYDEAFERAIVFLDTSRITYEAELKNQEMLQKRMLRRARVTNIVLSLAFIVAMVFFFFGLTQRIDAEKKADLADQARQEAEVAKNDAIAQEKVALQAAEQLQEQQNEINEKNKRLEEALKQTQIAKAEAEESLKKAKIAERVANNARSQEAAQRIKAEEATQRAEENFKKANALLMLSIAQAMEVKAETMDDAQLSGLLALQGYKFHTRYDGKKYDPYVFRGLYYANAKLKGYNYNAAQVPGNYRNRMSGLAVSSNSEKFYVTGSDGRVFAGDILRHTIGDQVLINNHPNRVVALSSDDKHLVVGTDSSAIQIYSVDDGGKPRYIGGHKASVNDIKFLPDNSGFISVASDNSVRFTDHRTGASKQLLTLPMSLKSISINNAGTMLVGASNASQVVLIDLKNNSYNILKTEAPNRVLSVAFHPTSNRIAYGLEMIDGGGLVTRGLVKVVDLNTNRVKELGGHRAGVSDIEYSPDGLLLAAASQDRKLQLWVVDKEEDLPVVMDNNNGTIWNIGFSRRSDYLIASCNNGEIRIWPTDPKVLADHVCPELKRSFTKEEWDIYIGQQIDIEKTCGTK
jgi:energy-coupling factor transporter ATP-binding protein EcfA2